MFAGARAGIVTMGAALGLFATAGPGAALEITPRPFDFGDVEVGGTPAARAFTLTTNPGETADLSIAGTGFSRLTPAPEAPGVPELVPPCETVAPDDRLPGNIECYAVVQFAPTQLGPASGSLSLVGVNGTGTLAAALSGTGAPPPAPADPFSPGSVDFGSVSTGLTVLRDVTVGTTLQNAVPLNLDTLAVTGRGYSIVDPAGAFDENGACIDRTERALGLNLQCTVTVAFTPTVAGAASGSLAVQGRDGSTPTFSASLSGTGVGTAIGRERPVVIILGAGTGDPITFTDSALGPTAVVSATYGGTIALRGTAPAGTTVDLHAEDVVRPSEPVGTGGGQTETVTEKRLVGQATAGGGGTFALEFPAREPGLYSIGVEGDAELAPTYVFVQVEPRVRASLRGRAVTVFAGHPRIVSGSRTVVQARVGRKWRGVSVARIDEKGRARHRIAERHRSRPLRATVLPDPDFFHTSARTTIRR